MGVDERGPGMDESSSDDTRSGVTRREAIKKGAIVGGTVMWVAPLVQTVGMSPASAQTVSPQPGACVCTGTNSFDVTAAFTGVVSGNVGPFQDFPAETGCLANLSVAAPNAPLATAFLTSGTDCVGGSTAGGECVSFVEVENLHADLTAINSALDVQLDAIVVQASAECTCGFGCAASACITQAAGQAIVTVAGQTLLAGTEDTLCSRQEIAINIPATAVSGAITGTIVLNDTSTDPCQATVATINATVTDLLGNVTQTVNVVIARATAVCTQG